MVALWRISRRKVSLINVLSVATPETGEKMRALVMSATIATPSLDIIIISAAIQSVAQSAVGN
ncbi:MAG: hypothetical protein PHE02_15205 [Lachnospiraceae bacterium]|nr:hypothetical protein [Lachnospiraceae bacterium]